MSFSRCEQVVGSRPNLMKGTSLKLVGESMDKHVDQKKSNLKEKNDKQTQTQKNREGKTWKKLPNIKVKK